MDKGPLNGCVLNGCVFDFGVYQCFVNCYGLVAPCFKDFSAYLNVVALRFSVLRVIAVAVVCLTWAGVLYSRKNFRSFQNAW